MKIPLFRAKDKDSDRYFTGFYFEYPATTFCFTEDYHNGKVKIIKCLVSHTSTDWGLPNKPILITIDENTLEKIGEIETDNKDYIPDEYIKHDTFSQKTDEKGK